MLDLVCGVPLFLLPFPDPLRGLCGGHMASASSSVAGPWDQRGASGVQ